MPSEFSKFSQLSQFSKFLQFSKFSRNQRWFLCCFCLALTSEIILFCGHFSLDVFRGFQLGLGFSLLNGALVFFSLNAVFHKSNFAFFSTFYALIFWKLLLLAGIVYVLLDRSRTLISATAFSLVSFTFIFSLISLYFLRQDQNGLQRNS